jgi:hypothetical protein
MGETMSAVDIVGWILLAVALAVTLGLNNKPRP